MSKKEIRLQFDLDDAVDNRVYFALKKLPNFLNEPDLSKAIILFINNAVNTIGECEERTTRCEETLKALLGSEYPTKTDWN